MATIPASRPSSFPKFSNLPKELRLAIWTFATNQPRIVCVQIDKVLVDGASFSVGKRRHGKDGFRYTTTSRTYTPAILHTCQESRFEGLKAYTLVLGYPDSHIYVNPDRDIVYAYNSIESKERVHAGLENQPLGPVRHLMVNCNEGCTAAMTGRIIGHVVKHHKQSESLLLVRQDSDDFSCDGYDDIEEDEEAYSRLRHKFMLHSDEMVEHFNSLALKIMRRVG